jgi:hypothetical protein
MRVTRVVYVTFSQGVAVDAYVAGARRGYALSDVKGQGLTAFLQVIRGPCSLPR